MFSKEVNLRSPVRLLESSIHGGLGAGNLGVVMARAGVGKTAFLVQVALDDLMREKDVIHFALGQKLEHVQTWYDALFDDLAEYTALEDRQSVREDVMHHHVIQAYGEHRLSVEQLEKSIALYGQHMKISPKAIIIDGFDWEGPMAETAAALGAFKSTADRLGAELWMSAQVHRSKTPEHPTTITAPCDQYRELIDVAVFLEPHGDHATVRILKDHNNKDISDSHLTLACDTLRLVNEDDEKDRRVQLPPSAFTLLSGGANGAEEEFGECAEKYHVHELNYTFHGRQMSRYKNAVMLDDHELGRGHVSHAYLQAQMHRTYPTTPQFQKMLDTIWHQVNTAGEVFVVGTVLPDKTVKGGTGWAAELARHWKKPLYVFDQEKHGWLEWTDAGWVAKENPVITKTRFCGTGTRFLSDDGRRAIQDLFARSFGG
jgi:KaiC/GvpD/RAD55 family RecA-like ATPase